MADTPTELCLKKCLNPSCKEQKSDCGGRCDLCRTPLCYWLGNDEGDTYCSLTCETYNYINEQADCPQ